MKIEDMKPGMVVFSATVTVGDYVRVTDESEYTVVAVQGGFACLSCEDGLFVVESAEWLHPSAEAARRAALTEQLADFDASAAEFDVEAAISNERAALARSMAAKIREAM